MHRYIVAACVLLGAGINSSGQYRDTTIEATSEASILGPQVNLVVTTEKCVIRTKATKKKDEQPIWQITLVSLRQELNEENKTVFDIATLAEKNKTRVPAVVQQLRSGSILAKIKIEGGFSASITNYPETMEGDFDFVPEPLRPNVRYFYSKPNIERLVALSFFPWKLKKDIKRGDKYTTNTNNLPIARAFGTFLLTTDYTVNKVAEAVAEIGVSQNLSYTAPASSNEFGVRFDGKAELEKCLGQAWVNTHTSQILRMELTTVAKGNFTIGVKDLDGQMRITQVSTTKITTNPPP